MGIKVFPQDTTNGTAPKNRFADDVVGRFRSGHVLSNRPIALTEWRVTTGDPEVAGTIHDLLGGDAPQEWETSTEETLEVFTASNAIEVILDPSRALKQEMIWWGRNGVIQKGDGEVITYPEEKAGPDPDADLPLAERKQKAKDGIGPGPSIEVFFRLADEPDLGVFKFQSGSWSLASDLAYNDTEGKLADSDGLVRATLSLEKVEYKAKAGPRAGSLVSYTKPVLKLKGSVK